MSAVLENVKGLFFPRKFEKTVIGWIYQKMDIPLPDATQQNWFLQADSFIRLVILPVLASAICTLLLWGRL